jgi:hypothetical protein
MLLATLVLGLAPLGSDEVAPRLTWKGEAHALDALPSALPAPARASIEGWSAWAREHEHDLWLLDDASVLLAARPPQKAERSREALGEQLEMLVEAREVFERIAPVPATRDASAGLEWPGRDEVAVLLCTSGWETYEATVDRLVGTHPYLAPRAPGLKKLPGFVLQRPLLAAWPAELPKADLFDASGLEWDADNEMVNRVAQVLLMRRFDTQPVWVQLGLAWYVEHEVRGSFYCFPHRTGFVGAAEHDGWGSELRRAFKKEGFSIGPLADWERGTFDDALAHQAWGVVRFLAEEEPAALPLVLEDFRARRERDGRRTSPDGSWEILPDYEIPAAEQHALLAARLGEDYAERITAWFRKGAK